MRGLGFDNSNKLHADEQSVVGKAVRTRGGIGRPFGNGEVSSGRRASALGVAKIFGISFPADFAKLFVDEQTSFSLGDIAAGRGFLGKFPALRLGRRGSFGGTGFGLRHEFFVCGNGSGNRDEGRLDRGNKGGVLVVLVAVRLIEPAAKTVHDLEIVESLLLGQNKPFVSGLVASFAYKVKGFGHVLREETTAAEYVDTLCCVGAVRQSDLIHGEHDFDHAFAEQANLDEAGVGVRTAVGLSKLGQLRKFREFFVQEGKVGSHVRPHR